MATVAVIPLVVVATFVAVGATVNFVWPASVVGTLFLGVYFLRRGVDRRDANALTVAAAVAWMAYCAWEALLYYRVLCDEDCNIRIDLLLILPLLMGVSSVATAMQVRRPRGRRIETDDNP